MQCVFHLNMIVVLTGKSNIFFEKNWLCYSVTFGSEQYFISKNVVSSFWEPVLKKTSVI